MKKTNLFILIGILLIIVGISLINYFDSNKPTEIKETHTFTYIKVNIFGKIKQTISTNRPKYSVRF